VTNIPICEVISWNQWNDKDRILEIPTEAHGTAGVICYKSKSGYSFLKFGFHTMFNPVCQFGGPLWGATPKFYNLNERDSFDVKMDQGWIESGNVSDWVFKGDKLTGLHHHEYPRRISITEEVIDNQRT
jgi:hypothetical protein